MKEYTNGYSPRETVSNFTKILLFIAILGIYTQASFGFPNSIFIISTALLCIPVVLSDARYFFPAAAFSLIGLMSVLLGIIRGVASPGQVYSLGLLVLTVFGSTGFAQTVRRLGPERVSRWFWRLSVALIILAILEVLGPLRPISDAVRHAIYTSGVYGNDARDIATHGFVRPKVFTSEPSHLGKFLAVFLIVSATNSRKRAKHLIAGVLGYLVVSSPAVLLSLMVIPLLIIRDRGFKRTFSSPLAIALLALISVGFVTVLINIVYTRFGLFGGTIDPSIYLRIIRPIYMVLDVTASNPLLGYGLGADDSLMQVAINATEAGPRVAFVESNLDKLGAQYGVSQVGMLLTLGWLGSFLWVLALIYLRRTFGGDSLAFWAFWFGYGIFQGSINTPLHFAPLFLMAVSHAPAPRPFEATRRRRLVWGRKTLLSW